MTDIARRNPDEDPPMIKLLRQYEPDLAAALPDGYTEDRFKSVVLNQIRQNRQLLTVEPLTLVASVLMAAQLGLEPGPPLGLSWIIPRKNRGKDEATFQIGYKGYVQLAYRTGIVRHISAHIVEEGDDFDWSYGRSGPDWNWKSLGEAGRDWTHVFANTETVTGGIELEVMTKAQVLAHRDRYIKYWKDSRAWKENEPEMAKKTAVRRVTSLLPMSAEFRNASMADGLTPRELRPDLAGMLALEAAETGEGIAMILSEAQLLDIRKLVEDFGNRVLFGSNGRFWKRSKLSRAS